MSFTYKPYRDACFERACRYRAVARSLAALAAVGMWLRYVLGGIRVNNALLEAVCVTAILGMLIIDQWAANREHRESEEDPDRTLRGRRRAAKDA